MPNIGPALSLSRTLNQVYTPIFRVFCHTIFRYALIKRLQTINDLRAHSVARCDG